MNLYIFNEDFKPKKEDQFREGGGLKKYTRKNTYILRPLKQQRYTRKKTNLEIFPSLLASYLLKADLTSSTVRYIPRNLAISALALPEAEIYEL